LLHYEICFTYAASLDERLVVGDAIRWVGPQVWRVEAIDGNHITARLWPNDEPYPERIRESGPGSWPSEKRT
jgi:hypothetical protein